MASEAVRALYEKNRLTDWWTSEFGRRYAYAVASLVRDGYDEIISGYDSVMEDLHRQISELEHLQEGEDGSAAHGDQIVALSAQLEASQGWLAERTEQARQLQLTEDITVDWPEREARRLRVAETFWVAEPMASLVNAAYDSMPEQALRHEDLPTECGFALIEGHASLAIAPDGSSDRDRTHRIGFSALSWAHVSQGGKAGTQITWWTTLDAIPRDMRDVDFGPTTLLPYSYFWADGATEPEVPFEDEAGMIERHHGARWVQAFWNLMARPMVARERTEADRASRRRAQKAGDLAPKITVITLRSPKSKATGEPSHVDWKSRWLVRGFWRQQWYPTLREHRAIWIDAHVKGPQDRPLRIREHVYAWRR